MVLEPNDLISEASDSGIGYDRKSNITFSSSIDTISDVDFYQFELEQGQGITLDIDTINLTKDSTKFDSYLRVFDADGNELNSNDDSFAQSNSGLDSYIGFIANSTGQYYVGVSDTVNRDYNPIEVGDVDLAEDNSIPSNYTPGDYDLTLKIVQVESDKDPDNTVSEAIALSVDRETQAAVTSKEIATKSDVDLYEIELGEAKGVKLKIDTQRNDSDLDTYLRVFDADGKEVAFNDNSEDLDNITSDSILAFAPETSGKYYIGVSSAGNFEYDAVNGDTNLNSSLNTAVSTGNYELQLEIVDVIKDDDANNTIEEAIATTVDANSNSPIIKSEEIDSKFDVDIFKFELQEGEGIKLDVNASKLGSDLDSYLRIFDSQGNELSVDDNNDANFTGDFSSDSSLAFVPDAPGEYYVGVGTSGNFDYDPINGRTNFSKDNLSPFATTGSYELVINPTAIVGDEDPDNTISEAIATQGNTEIVGKIEAGDVDLYKFQLERGEGVTFDLNASSEDSNLDSYLRLFDSLGNQVAFDNDDDSNIAEDSNFDSLLRFAVDTSGEYYLGVSSDGNTDYNPIEGRNNFTPITGRTTGSYSLAIDRAPLVADTDSDNTISEAVKISLAEQPITISKAIDSLTDVDIYQLELDAGNTISLDIDAAEIGSELDSVLQIFNADGEKLATNDDASAPNENSAIDSYLEFTALTAGSYYVGVSSYDNFDYDSVNGSNNFSNNFGNTTGEYDLVVDLLD